MGYQEVCMAQLTAELQEAQDHCLYGKLEACNREVETIHCRTQHLRDLLHELLAIRDNEEKENDLSQLEEKIQNYQKNIHPQEYTTDPFASLYPGPLQAIPDIEIDHCISEIQEVMRRDSLSLQKHTHESEFAMQLYSALTQMLTWQKQDENRTFVRNQRTGG